MAFRPRVVYPHYKYLYTIIAAYSSTPPMPKKNIVFFSEMPTKTHEKEPTFQSTLPVATPSLGFIQQGWL